jgi:hypothetical protein
MKNKLCSSYLLLILVFPALIFFSCDDSSDISRFSDYTTQEVSVYNSHELVLKDTVYLSLDSVSDGDMYYGQVLIIDSVEQFLVFNTSIHALDFYNLKTGERVNRILLDTEGPNAVENVDRFFYHNVDSIFFFSSDKREIAIVNSQGLNTRRVPIVLERDGLEYFPTVENFFQFKYLERYSAVTFWAHPLDKMSYDGYDYWEEAKGVLYNLSTGKIDFFGHFPSAYYRNENIFETLEFFASVVKDEKILLYFHASEEVMNYHVEEDTLVYYQIPSENFEEPEPIMKLGADRPDLRTADRYFTEKDLAIRMIAAEGSNYYYRFIKHGVPHDLGGGKIRNFYDKPFSIQVLDGNLNVLSEQSFKRGEFDFYQAFAIDDKLYVSLNNPLNEISQNEKVHPFAVFDLIAKSKEDE